ncbi:uncharacterized protein LOC134782611 [Penaeus indicus]|uniref:uncharacterized protein LOC134782611 n=1 Tax=Penaeus indicus TaxID=29960 RepID=UPI00300CD383
MTVETKTKTRTVSFGEDQQSECEAGRDDVRDGVPYDDEDDDAASVTSLPAELPPPPDGGWGWVIVVVSFLCNAIVDGVAYSFSPYIDILSKQFDAPKGKVAWIPSLLAGVYLSAGPIVSALSNKFGCRIVCCVGGLVASLAYFLTIFANSTEYLMVFQGCCAEYSILFFQWFGALMRPLEVPRMKKKDLLQRLAEEKRATMARGSICDPNREANADPGVHSHLNLSGYLTPVGTTLALPTIQETQGNTPPDQEAPIAVTDAEEVSPTTPPAAEQDTTDERQNLVNGAKASAVPARMAAAAKIPRNCSQPVMARDPTRQIPKNGSVPNFERKLSKVDIANHMKVVPATPKASSTNLRGLGSQEMMRRVSSGYGRVNSNNSFVDPEMAGALRQRRSSSKSMMLRPMSRHDIFYSGSIANLREFKSQESMLSYRESALNLQGTGASKVVIDALDGPEEERGLCSCLPESMRGTLSQMMDFSLLKNPVFLMIGVANLFGMLGFYTPFVYLPDAAKEKGVDPDYATFLVSIIGITNTIGRVLSGLIADIPKVSALWVNNICIILSGVCVFLTPFASSYGAFVTISLFFGFFVSPFIALTSIIIVDLLGLRQLTNAFGLLCIFRGVAGILGPPVSGSIAIHLPLLHQAGSCKIQRAYRIFLFLLWWFWLQRWCGSGSPFIALTSIIIVDLLGLRQLTNAFGLLCIFRGVAGILGPPVSGSIAIHLPLLHQAGSCKIQDVRDPKAKFSGVLCLMCESNSSSNGIVGRTAYISLSSIILVELLGLSQLTNAFGLLILFRGSASMVGPPIAGSIYDATKNYDVSFYSAGALLFVCAALHCLVPCVQRMCDESGPVGYTTNEEWQMDAVPEEDEDEGAVSPDTGEGIGIILDIKPKITTVLHQDSGENKIVLDSTQNEKGKEIVSSL